MGRTYWFECAKCGYRAKVSGRADRGLNFFVQTIVCRDCRKLYDAVKRLRVAAEPQRGMKLGLKHSGLAKRHDGPPRPPTFEAALNRLAIEGLQKSRWIKFDLRCPVSAWHKIEEWRDPGLCPRCGTFLDKNAVPYRIWE